MYDLCDLKNNSTYKIKIQCILNFSCKFNDSIWFAFRSSKHWAHNVQDEYSHRYKQPNVSEIQNF